MHRANKNVRAILWRKVAAASRTANMPATTRAQSQRSYNLPSTILENANSYLSSKLSTKKVGYSSYPTNLSSSIQNPIAFKKPCRAKGPLSSSRKPRKRPRKHQRSNKREQSQTATEISSPDLSDSTITHWACQTCSCSQGAFDYPVDSCIRCGHTMEHHEEVPYYEWDPRCDNICEREDLVFVQVLSQTLHRKLWPFDRPV